MIGSAIRVLSNTSLKRRTLIGTICLLLAFPVVFFLFIEPVKVVIEQVKPGALPADWMQRIFITHKLIHGLAIEFFGSKSAIATAKIYLK